MKSIASRIYRDIETAEALLDFVHGEVFDEVQEGIMEQVFKNSLIKIGYYEERV